VEPPVKREGDVTLSYLWAGKINGERACDIRYIFVTALRERGIPFRLGIQCHFISYFKGPVSLPVAESRERAVFTFGGLRRMIPNKPHLTKMRDIILEEAERPEKEVDMRKTVGKRGHRGLINLRGSLEAIYGKEATLTGVSQSDSPRNS